MTTRYPGNALVAHTDLNRHERAGLSVGEDIIVSVRHGRQRIRATITATTPTQITLDNDSRYSTRSGLKIGYAGSYDPPRIIGRAKHTREEADRINAAIVAAAEEAQRKASLADILDRVEALADETGKGIGAVLEELNDLNIARLGEAIRANEEAKRAGQ